MIHLGDWLEAAVNFAHGAGEITERYFGGAIAAEWKGDGSPVTRADREAEAYLRQEILKRFPAHGILGEEYGEEIGSDPTRWILDPIDGTRAFMRGVPLYGVLIGIEHEGEPVVGVAHFPALGETVAAAKGHGCSWNGAPCRVSGVSSLADAGLLTTDVLRMPMDESLEKGWAALAAEASLTRTWGDAFGHALVATGRAEVMIDPIFSAWDASPFLTILEEAGGRFTDRQGNRTIHGGSGISTNGHLHDRILRTLNGEG